MMGLICSCAWYLYIVLVSFSIELFEMYLCTPTGENTINL